MIIQLVIAIALLIGIVVATTYHFYYMDNRCIKTCPTCKKCEECKPCEECKECPLCTEEIISCPKCPTCEEEQCPPCKTCEEEQCPACKPCCKTCPKCAPCPLCKTCELCSPGCDTCINIPFKAHDELTRDIKNIVMNSSSSNCKMIEPKLKSIFENINTTSQTPECTMFKRQLNSDMETMSPDFIYQTNNIVDGLCVNGNMDPKKTTKLLNDVFTGFCPSYNIYK